MSSCLYAQDPAVVKKLLDNLQVLLVPFELSARAVARMKFSLKFMSFLGVLDNNIGILCYLRRRPFPMQFHHYAHLISLVV